MQKSFLFSDPELENDEPSGNQQGVEEVGINEKVISSPEYNPDSQSVDGEDKYLHFKEMSNIEKYPSDDVKFLKSNNNDEDVDHLSQIKIKTEVSVDESNQGNDFNAKIEHSDESSSDDGQQMTSQENDNITHPIKEISVVESNVADLVHLKDEDIENGRTFGNDKDGPTGAVKSVPENFKGVEISLSQEDDKVIDRKEINVTGEVPGNVKGKEITLSLEDDKANGGEEKNVLEEVHENVKGKKMSLSLEENEANDGEDIKVLEEVHENVKGKKMSLSLEDNEAYDGEEINVLEEVPLTPAAKNDDNDDEDNAAVILKKGAPPKQADVGSSKPPQEDVPPKGADKNEPLPTGPPRRRKGGVWNIFCKICPCACSSNQ